MEGTIDLMIYYVERGTEFTCAFGDMDENFYYSLESMFDNVMKEIDTHNLHKEEFIFRLQKIVENSNDIGWGYYDSLNGMFNKWKKHKGAII